MRSPPGCSLGQKNVQWGSGRVWPVESTIRVYIADLSILSCGRCGSTSKRKRERERKREPSQSGKTSENRVFSIVFIHINSAGWVSKFTCWSPEVSWGAHIEARTSGLIQVAHACAIQAGADWAVCARSNNLILDATPRTCEHRHAQFKADRTSEGSRAQL